ncbi:hypothetical protein, partial [Acidithiobacillus thiooxidans]|uniref:hypothetical protein n=1 Tax=Acidithiobacillus thiooxidans TaxID=930 RepID=UPI001A7E04DF
ILGIPNTSRSDGTANQAVKQRCCTSNLKPPRFSNFYELLLISINKKQTQPFQLITPYFLK